MTDDVQSHQDDSDVFGQWLAGQTTLAPQPAQIGNAYVQELFQMVVRALRTGDRDVELESDVELLMLVYEPVLVRAGVSADAARAFFDAVNAVAADSTLRKAADIRALLQPLVLGLGAPQPLKKALLESALPSAVDVLKVDTDQRLVTGWASVIENPDGSPLADHEGDMIDEDELVQAAHEFIKDRAAGDMHRRITGIGEIVESLVVTKALKKALHLPDTVPVGWLITVKVTDEPTWIKVKKGEYRMFSIGGSAVREAAVRKARGSAPLWHRLRT